MKNSRKVDGLQYLAQIPRRRAERFLEELANLRSDVLAIRRLSDRYPEILRGRAWWIPGQFEAREGTSPVLGEVLEQIDDLLWTAEMVQVRGALRTTWRESDLRRRDWLAFRLRDQLMARADPRFVRAIGVINGPAVDLIDRLPPPSPFEQAIMYLLKSADRARYCANPDCPAPYFLAKRRSQKYCSDACSKPAQKEFKRRWWDEHGDAWRKRRARKPQRKRGK